MLINFVDATNDTNHYTKPPPVSLPVRQRVMFKTVVLVWKCLNGAAPCYLSALCVRFLCFRSSTSQVSLDWFKFPESET